MQMPQAFLRWQLGRAISRRRTERFVVVAERRHEALARLVCQLLNSEQIPAGIEYVPRDETLRNVNGRYAVVVPAEQADRAHNLLAKYGDDS